MISAAGRRFTYAVCAVVGLAQPLAAQGVQAPPLTVHSIWGSPEYESDLVDVAWMKDGKAYTTLDDASGNSDLYRVDALTGKKDLLLRAADLVPPGARQPVTIEEYSFSADGSRLLIFTNSARVWRLNTKGTYYVWDFAAKRLIPVSTKPRGASLIIGEVIRFHVDDAIVDNFRIDPDKLRAIGRMGGDEYASTRDRFTMIRPKV